MVSCRLQTEMVLDYLEGYNESPSADKPAVECELCDSVQLGHGYTHLTTVADPKVWLT